MGRFFNCLNNGNRNYHTFCSSDDNVIYQQIGLPLMYFSAHSRYFDPAAIYLWSAKRRFQGRYRKHGSLDVGIRRKNLSDTVEQVMQVVRRFS